MRVMDPAVEFERCIGLVAASAARTAKRIVEPEAVSPLPPAVVPQPGMPGHELAVALALGPDEVELVWSVVGRAVEPQVAAHAREVFGAEARLGVSVAQHIAWRELPAERSRMLLAVLDAHHRLRADGILVPVGAEPFDVQTPWATSQRVCNFLRGLLDVDPSIAAVGGLVNPARARHSPDQRRVLQRIGDWLTSCQGATIQLEGPHGSGRRTAIAIAAAPRRVVAVDFSRVSVRRAESLLLALRREALLLDAVPVLANLDDLWSRMPPDEELKQALVVSLDALAGPLAITTTSATVELRAERRLVLNARWPLPDAATRRELWIEALGDRPRESELDLLAHRYELGAGGIAAAARSAHHRAEADIPALAELVAGVQDNIAERLGELARRVDVTQRWDELVLPPETRDDVAMLISRIRNAHAVLDGWGFRKKLARGAGVAALFSGPPGTGKTMVAGLIAHELKLELYQVDLSRIVSKWIGETEKQLAKVFEAAEAGHALLLFDEADALFAKRSAEVKSAVDRYANLEVNYLLQRVERFGGVVILTTNLDASIDPALRRRLASHIVFATPEIDERERLWEAMLDTNAPRARNLDLRGLAEEFADMTGANIRNSVLAAAFLAADEGQPISASHLQRAARSEYRAMGRVLGRSDHRRL
jgi:hypothetical protein